MKSAPKISIVIPTSDMKGGRMFIIRSLNALKTQTFKDFEIVITDDSVGNDVYDIANDFWPLTIRYFRNENPLGMAGNTNMGIKMSLGEIVKILYLDDYLSHPNALNDIASHWKGGWMVTACIHDDGTNLFNQHYPLYGEKIINGVNTIGSPSVLSFENNKPLLFDETMTWLLDCDLYKRLYERYGEPNILNDINVVIGVGLHQTTYMLSDEVKLQEYNYMKQKYAN